MPKTSINTFVNKKNISSLDRGFNFGDGLFETILVQNNKPLYLKEHIERLHKGCCVLGLIKPSNKLIYKNIKLAIGNSNNCIVKIIFTRGSSSYGYKIDDNLTPNLYFFKHQIQISGEKFNTNQLGISTYILKANNDLSKIKHLNRIEQVMISKNLLKQSKYRDLIAVDANNNIIECISSNIFFVNFKKSTPIFYTPIIKDVGIEGILRSKIISFLKNKQYIIKIINIPLSKIDKFDACFTTNSIRGVTFISQIKKTKFFFDDFLYNVLKKYIYN
ncbi:MAG: aminodeoxychorismate lyase [Gammaproteobacteria bacterium]|nr:aminodeoxychorismate lyase [Gammaproteobacteria bacterium]|tara:strand:- start:16430 stop:17254 length:825 start_codon:yes stop_codon:yes gene_type:complete